MQRQSNRHDRWTLMSFATMVTLLSCSVGCVSLKHHMNRHSVVSTVLEKQDARYYHCSHCGQIIPREGFSKCPRCFQVPLYHGYEPTCWRQWPSGWGCPPESVAGHPQFYAEGMLESDAETEQPPVDQAEPVQEAEAPAVEDVQIPEADAKPIRTDVSLPKQRNDIVEQSKPAEHPPFVMIADEKTAKPVIDAYTIIDAEPVADAGPVADAEPLPVAEPVAVKTIEQPALLADSVMAPDQHRDNRTPLGVTASAMPPSPQVAKSEKPEPTQAEASLQPTPSEVRVAATAEPVAKIEPIAETEEVTPEVSDPEPVLAAMTMESDSSSAKVPAPDQEAVAQRSIVSEEPALETVNRIPIPTRKVMMLTEASAEAVNETTEPMPAAASLVRTEAAVIDAVVTEKAETPVAVAKPIKVENELISPRDHQGPIPVRKVKLADVEAKKPQPPQPSIANGNEEFPVPVSRIALPTSSQTSPARIEPEQILGEPHPAPVRRIQLSELPIRIQR